MKDIDDLVKGMRSLNRIFEEGIHKAPIKNDIKLSDSPEAARLQEKAYKIRKGQIEGNEAITDVEVNKIIDDIIGENL